MTKNELVTKVGKLEKLIWDCGIDEIISEWDDYADALLEEVEFWDNLLPDQLYQAYEKGLLYVIKINPNKTFKTILD